MYKCFNRSYFKRELDEKLIESYAFDYTVVKNQALSRLRIGKFLLGRGGAFTRLFNSFLDAAPEAELSDHLMEHEDEEDNRRNGLGVKQLGTS